MNRIPVVPWSWFTVATLAHFYIESGLLAELVKAHCIWILFENLVVTPGEMVLGPEWDRKILIFDVVLS